MSSFLGVLFLLSFVSTLIAGIVMAFKRNPKWKMMLLGALASFVLLCVTVSLDPVPTTTPAPVAASAPAETPLQLSQKAYKAGVEQFNNHNYDAALISLSKVIKEDTNYADAQEKIKKINNIKVAGCLAKAKKYLQNNDFVNAQSETDKALKIDSNNSEAVTLQKSIKRQKLAYEQKKKQQEVYDYKNSCQSISYKVLNKNPDSLTGKKVKLRGEIMQIQEDGGQTAMLLSVTDLGYGVWTDNVAVYYQGTADVYEDDVITIWGEVGGAFTYKSQAGWNITVPSVKAKYIAKG